MNALPKLKRAGVITAQSTSDPVTATAAHYDVGWTDGLAFRNDANATAAVTVTPHGKDPKRFGLHLTADAARMLATELGDAAAARRNVAVFNHRDGLPNVWERFSAPDAEALAQKLALAAMGH